MITREQIREANAAGLRHASLEDGPCWSYMTPVLQAAYDLGRYRRRAVGALVRGYRYGAAPASGLSWDYRAGRALLGLSLAALDGEREIGSSMWFADRERHEYEGLDAGRGPDGEPLILICTHNYGD